MNKRTLLGMKELMTVGLVEQDYRLCVLAHYVMTGDSIWGHNWKEEKPLWYLEEVKSNER